jgi:hypothetical protein
MFRFLGGRNSHRKKRHARDDVEKQKKNSGRRNKEPSHQIVVSPRNNLPQTTNPFFDDRSIGMSIYTTPSKSTIHYSCLSKRDTYHYKWQSSSQGTEGPGTEFTAEVALIQYRLGGWQSPPSPAVVSRPESSLTSSSLSSSSLSSSLASPVSPSLVSPSSSYRNNKKRDEIIHSMGSQPTSSSWSKLSLASITPSLKTASYSVYSSSSRSQGEGTTGSESLFSRASYVVDVDSLMFVKAKELNPIPNYNYIEDDSTACSDKSFDLGAQNLIHRMSTSGGTRNDKMMTISPEQKLAVVDFEEENDVQSFSETSFGDPVRSSQSEEEEEESTSCSSISTLTMDNFAQHISTSQRITSRTTASSHNHANFIGETASTGDTKSQSTEVSILTVDDQLFQEDRRHCHVLDNKSLCDNDYSILTISTSGDEQLSFSEMINRYEAVPQRLTTMKEQKNYNPAAAAETEVLAADDVSFDGSCVTLEEVYNPRNNTVEQKRVRGTTTNRRQQAKKQSDEKHEDDDDDNDEQFQEDRHHHSHVSDINSLCDSDQSILALLIDNEQLSFSGFLALCEAESLAGRLAPDLSPTEKLIGRTISTDSSKAASDKDGHAPLSPVIGSEGLAVNSVPVKGKCAKMKSIDKGDQVKLSSTRSKGCSWVGDYVSVLPASFEKFTLPSKGTMAQRSQRDANSVTKSEDQAVNFIVETPASKSVSNSRSPENINFSVILSKFEAQSLENRMSSPAPRRLPTGRAFQAIAVTDKKDGNLRSLDETPELRHEQQYISSENSPQRGAQSLRDQIAFPFPPSSEEDCSVESAKSSDANSSGTCEDSILTPPSLTEGKLEDQSDTNSSGTCDDSILTPPSFTEGKLEDQSDAISSGTCEGSILTPLSFTEGKLEDQSDTNSSGTCEDSILTPPSFTKGKLEDQSATNRSGTCEDSILTPPSFTEAAWDDQIPPLSTKIQVNTDILGLEESPHDEDDWSEPYGIFDSNDIDNCTKKVRLSSNSLNLKLLLNSQPEGGFQESDSINTRDLATTILDITSKPNSQIHHLRYYTGPVDLDESISDSSSESSVLREGKTLQMPDFDHRFFFQDKYDDCNPSAWAVNVNADTSGLKSRVEWDGNWSLVDESSVNHQVPCKYDSPGCLLLKEEELSRHKKLVSPLPESPIKGYDNWRMKQESEILYFDKLEVTMKRQQNKREKSEHLHSSGSPSKLSQYHLSFSYDAATDTMLDKTKPMMDESMDSTIPTIQGYEIPSQKNEIPSQKKKTRGWNFLKRVMHKKDDATIGAKRDKKKTKKKMQNKKKVLKATKNKKSDVVSIDKFMEMSNDDHSDLVSPSAIADLSLIPLMNLGHFTKITGGDGDPNDKMLHHLKWERMKQKQAESDKDRDEWREQIRISMLKEQELERQRRLNSSSDSDCSVTLQVAMQGIGFSKNQTDLDHQRNAHPSFKSEYSLSAQKSCQKESIYCRGINNYFCDTSRITDSTARESESLESCSIDSFVRKNLSFDSVLSPSSSLNSPRSVSHLTPCVICTVSERSHISMPCMHYSFCSECSEDLSKVQIPICPICQTKDIVLSRVYT